MFFSWMRRVGRNVLAAAAAAAALMMMMMTITVYSRCRATCSRRSLLSKNDCKAEYDKHHNRQQTWQRRWWRRGLVVGTVTILVWSCC